MSGRSQPTIGEAKGLLDKVEELHGAEATGVLAVSREGWTHCRIFVLSGDVIACNAEEDNARLELMLLADGHVEYKVLDEVRDSVRKGGDLGDLLVQGGHVAGETLMDARARLFRDGFLWAAAAEEPQLIWDPRDAIFPDNMQFGIDVPQLLSDARGWFAANRHTLSLLASGDYFVAHGRRPKEVNDAAWAAISVPHAGKALVEAIGAPSREQGVESLTGLFARGVMTIARDSDGREKTRRVVATDETETESMSHQAVIASNTAEGMDIAARLAGDPADDLPGVPIEELAGDTLESPGGEPTEELLDDYERAARGDFIKSYEVLDKVDLSGVAVLGTGGMAESLEEIPAIEMGDEDDMVDEDLSDPELDVMLDALDRDFPDPAKTAPQLGTLKELDTAELMAPQEDDFDVFASPSDLPELPDQAYEQPEAETEQGFHLPSHVTGPFPRPQLTEYYETISVFNNIFRIIYGTFSEHIGADNARQRFVALASSNQRQYPELFQNVMVLDDGAVEPASIIENLAKSTDDNYGTLLHQGLYELIFSHLYDAKDMLPGDVESHMMEQILVYDRQLAPQ